ncbi:hypothetical protein C8J47_1808 [Sphingomonas sp. PP-F2F-G114-C0414]|uniref:hypothetical protein n=1 Tax=Sphingomonas sp. PP-F2F-G114-C0414 TaxID=2135662 RepID=UPI000F229CA7|nr:hypothetical protein [Sphingomonas sp. PP-F2F-G114-C0414]RMB36272.1 hypothetical protein C8J47_1808 [Sphingomonas sp. PP-F2F-G114-C0414]
MRVTLFFILCLAAVCFVSAFKIATSPPTVDRATITAPGVVTTLADGPHHAIVTVAPRGGSPFTFPANTQAGLDKGQQVTVRYQPGEAVATAHVVEAGATGNATTVWSLVIVGVLLLAAAGIGPYVVRLYPDVFAFRIRP